MKEKSKILECALEGIQLSEDEVRLVEWITGWDLWTQPPKSQLGEEIICYLSWKLYVN